MAAPRRISADIAGRFDGGVVFAVSPSPSGDATAFVWSEREFPAWPRVGVIDHRGKMVLTPPEVRIWGRPSWAASGELAVGGFAGVRRVVFDIDLATGAARHLAGDPAARLRPRRTRVGAGRRLSTPVAGRLGRPRTNPGR